MEWPWAAVAFVAEQMSLTTLLVQHELPQLPRGSAINGQHAYAHAVAAEEPVIQIWIIWTLLNQAPSHLDPSSSVG